MEQDWAKEPWRVSLSGTGIVDKQNVWVAGRDTSNAMCEEDAERAVACVNACAGVPTEILPELTSLLKRFILWLEPIQKVSIKEPPDADPAA